MRAARGSPAWRLQDGFLSGDNATGDQKAERKPDHKEGGAAKGGHENGAEVSAGDREVLARSTDKDAHGRSYCVWIHAAEPSSEYRWRYPNLEELLAQPAARRPDFAALLEDKDPTAAANAALALARLSDGRGRERLAETVRSPETPLSMRLRGGRRAGPSVRCEIGGAASRTLGSIRPKREKRQSGLRSRPARRVDPRPARHADAADDVQFTAALRSPSAAVRVEALEAWSASRRGTLPVEAADLRGDGDARVRAAALAALAVQKHPQSLEYLSAALADNDFRVRRAIDGFGALARPRRWRRCGIY